MVFDQPKGNFDLMITARDLLQCCANLQASGQETEHSQLFCRNPKKRFGGPFPLPPLDLSPLDPETAWKGERVGIDSHQISLPFNSFLVDLSKRISKPLSKLYLPILFQFSDGRLKRSFDCSLPKAGLAKPVKVFIYSFEDVLTALRTSMEPMDQIAYTETYMKYGIEKFRQMAAASAIPSAILSAAIEWTNRLDSDPSLVRAKKCKSQLMRSAAIDPLCQIECHLTP